MAGVTIYHDLIAQGRRVALADGGRLEIEPAAGLSADQRQAIVTHKAQILDELRQDQEISRLLALGPALWRPDWRVQLGHA